MQTGSPMLVVHSTYVQLPGRKSVCIRLSRHTALDTSGRDPIFCFVTTELGQDSQLEKETACCVAYDITNCFVSVFLEVKPELDMDWIHPRIGLGQEKVTHVQL